jgi:hypothetical protein
MSEQAISEVGLPFPHPPLELVVHNAVYGVQHVPFPNGELMVLVQAFTPAYTITLKLNKEVAESLSSDIRPSPVQIATRMPQLDR